MTSRNSRITDVVVGVDIGGTKIALQVVALDGQVLSTDRFPTPRGKPPRVLIRALVDRVLEALAPSSSSGPRRLRALGVAVPGQVNAKGVVLGAGNLGWSQV